MKAFILAAGYATRMYPITNDVPKGLLDVGGAPILTHIVSRVGELENVTEVVVVTNARFAQQFETWKATEQPSVRVTILNDGTTTNENRLGAIGDLAFALEHVPLRGEDAVVVAGDNLFDFDLRPVQREFLRRRKTTLIVRHVKDHGVPSRYNDVKVEPDGRISQFREKPAQPETDFTAIALYFFPPYPLELLGEYLKDGNPDAPGHFIAWLVERVPCYAEYLPGRWYDVGSVKNLEDARARFGRDG